MISVSDAQTKIKANTELLVPVKIPLASAFGLVLAEDVYAACSAPNFNQAAMDGYAFRYEDLIQSKQFYVKSVIAAGDKSIEVTPTQHAARIFTGASVPKELDTVVMQEKVETQNDKITILDEDIQKGNNVRLAGSEIRKGDIALTKNCFLSPAAVGFLAAAGIHEVSVHPKPRVHIIITGKELILPGQPLLEGQVYESNSLLLQSALKQLHIQNITVDFVGDELNETTNAISKALETDDLILLTGGVSVGDYDFVVEAANACGVKQLFHKVKQRPGKPLYAGIKDKKIIFGLPGNPASVLTCFYNYVITAIECMIGQKNLIQKKWLPLSSAVNKKVKLTQFLKAIHNDQQVSPLPAQESFRLSSFSVANCLIVLPEEKLDFTEGEMVETLVLPYL
jgi:molybdopterin molybdotransferase